MKQTLATKTLHLISALLFLLMITVNALANLLPIQGETTGAISDSYVNLFAPTGLTFSVWGVIYLLLGAFVVIDLIRVFKNDARIQTADATRHALWFSISSLANGLWIFAWHSRAIGLSVLLMLVVLGSLILASFSTKSADLLTRTAFGVYLGWITVATIANLTTWFVDLGVDGLASSSVVLTIVILLIGGLIASAFTWFQKDIAYGAVVVWAYLGILIKHLDPQAFQGEYVGIIVTVIVVMLGLLAVNALTIIKRKNA
jgi:hypothetical protein